MAFKTRKKEVFLYSSPQEMYQDNKLKKIMGPLDYQVARDIQCLSPAKNVRLLIAY